MGGQIAALFIKASALLPGAAPAKTTPKAEVGSSPTGTRNVCSRTLRQGYSLAALKQKQNIANNSSYSRM